MLKYQGSVFHALANLLGLLQGVSHTVPKFEEAVRAGGVTTLEDQRVDFTEVTEIFEQFPIFKAALEKAGLQSSLDSYERLVRLFGSPIAFEKVKEAVVELQGRISDELSHLELWQITREESHFLKTDPFGEEIPRKFPVTRDDIEEAGKCLAFGRATACVFHLMRVVEVGLRALAASLNNPNLDPKRNPNWETILRKGDEDLAKPLNQRSPEWQADESFFSTAHANLRAVKDAWRNSTMHIERRYDPEEAEEVWNAVKAFMRHLSQKLSA